MSRSRCRGITLDSPVAAVLGRRKARRATPLVEGLGLRTVGDLLRHFPRRYLKTGELTEVASLQEGQPLTVVGEVVEPRSRPTRPADRQAAPRRGACSGPTARRCG